MKPLRVLVVLHDYLPLHKGGSEIHAHQVASELARRRHDVTALFTERDLAAQPGEIRRGELDGVKTIEVVHQREYADVRETWREEPSRDVFAEMLAQLRPDVVHFHHLAIWGSDCVRLAREAGARTLVTLHDYHLLCDAATLLRSDGELCTPLDGSCTDCLTQRHPLRPELWDGADREASVEDLWPKAARERLEHHRAGLARADVVIAPSRFLAERFEANGFVRADECAVMLYGYPGRMRAPRRREPGRTFRVGYVGGIYFSKGVHVLVDAFRHLEGVDAELHVHGHLDWFPDYVSGLRARGAGFPVAFHGPFDPPRLDAILAELDCLVVPSVWYENMPLTIREAYRNGLPVITTELGGMAESVVDGVSGLTFPRGDARALAQAIRRLAENPQLCDQLAAGRLEVPTLEEIVDRIEALYGG